MECGGILQKTTKMTKKALRGRKKLMYDALQSQLGVISAAAKQVGIDRTTHYAWLRKDDNYKKWVEELPEFTLDFVENALFKQIKEGNTTAMIFFLKCKGKGRGYIEKSEQIVEHKGEGFKLIIEKEDVTQKRAN